MDVLANKNLIDQSGNLYLAKDIIADHRLVIYYFTNLTSSEYPRSKSVSRNLRVLYARAKQREWLVEVIFISQDMNEEDMMKAFAAQGPWFAVQFKDEVLRQEMLWMYDVSCLPHITVVNCEGEVISRIGMLELEREFVGIHPTLDHWYNLL